MPGRASVGRSSHPLTNAPAPDQHVSLKSAVSVSGERKAARTRLLGSVPTTTLKQEIARPLTAFEKAVLAFDPIRSLKEKARHLAEVVRRILGR